MKRKFTVTRNGNEVAIIGFAINVPGANDVDAYWKMILEREEALSDISDDVLRSKGVSPQLLTDKNYVKKAFTVPDSDKFDAAFFSMSAREAETLDPQQRMFLELCWKGLEYSGYTPSTYDGRIGAFASVFSSSYLMNLYSHPDLIASIGEMSIRHGNDKDYLATRLAYKLNLTGPCLSIQTSCSSSLVSVHVAAQSLLSGESDMAIAGGVSVLTDQEVGYLYQDGGLTSKDGRCRPFDADTKGTAFSNGLGVVVLKRLDDAIRDNDTIYSVILGSAINNDGSNKIGFTAPSSEGQSEVIAEALEMSGVNARSIGLVEAHGTGTPLGDPIEIDALSSVYRNHTKDNQYCAIGSVKSNVGHLGVASGVAGLIKASLALHNRTLPPSINFETPNPNIDFENSPFQLNTESKEWIPDDEAIRRAAVSSFGMGGTNAHMVLEEYREDMSSSMSKEPQLMVVSAKSESAAQALANQLQHWLSTSTMQSLEDAAYTLSQGRDAFPFRVSLVASEARDDTQALKVNEVLEDPAVIFAFPGQGSQFYTMGRDLYQSNELFKHAVDDCLAIVERYSKLPIRELFTGQRCDVDINSTEVAQPALFIFGYAQAISLQQMNVVPNVVMGHSIGELVAATVAGVFDLASAIQIVLKRAQLMQSMPAGSMVSITASQDEAESIIAPYEDVSIAAINTGDTCILSGPEASIESLLRICALQGIDTRQLHTSHAFHSEMMAEAANEFEAFVSGFALSSPKIPVISNISGQVLTETEATDPTYWSKHIISPVLFAKSLLSTMQFDTPVIVDLGPGTNIAGFVRSSPALNQMIKVIPLHKHPKDQSNEQFGYLKAIGELWESGVDVDLAQLHKRPRKRVPMPTYVFDKHSYWIEKANSALYLSGTAASKEESELGAHPPVSNEINEVPTLTEFEEVNIDLSGDIEGRLKKIWCGLFGVDSVGLDEDFFALGGTSLVAIQLMSQVREQFGVEVDVEALFDDPTINGIAKQIRLRQDVTEVDQDELLRELLESEDIDLEKI
ncbi:acyltransferase domain-containing protein [Vibrio parahaemolyticus]|nr:acyltransferase domain-containing protein [Vibrio parahaemolyticus]